MTEDERKHVEQEISHLKAAARFLSQAGKVGRERLSCAMFLRALGVPFSAEELVAVPDDGPPDYIDVNFRDAHFQIGEVLNENCRRQDAMNARIRRYEQALQSWRSVPFSDVIAPHHRPMRYPMSYNEVYARLSKELAKKASRYGKKACAALDALGVVQLPDMSLDQASPLPDYIELSQQGWRSVSFIMPIYGHVVYATDAAPAFLQEHRGQTRRECEDPVIFFQQVEP
jgi:hypothetical protein